MKSRNIPANMAVAAGLLGIIAGSVQTMADAPGKHPYYLHALSDLRLARAHLEQVTPKDIVGAQEKQAIDEIDAAMREIRAASIDDGKDLKDHPPIDVKLSKADRYRQALQLLQQVEGDINQEEDDQDVVGLQKRAMMHVATAEKTVTTIIRETQPPPKHPAYLNALSDLRYARANLDKVGANEITNDREMLAIKQIDAAIGEIKAASIDDGKNLNDHPAIDVNVKKADRYRKSLELLQKAGGDIGKEEDDPAAQGLQKRAMTQIVAAEQTVTAIIKQPNPVIKHPDYLNALADLRFARAHLDKLGPDDIANDREVHAIREIDAAMHEIRAASIDDGKAPGEHEPIDVSLKKTDRYHKALELLEKATQDVKREEDDRSAQGLQQRALTHIQGAMEEVHKALAELLN
jgi:tetratricopeptide (TPR) repeat protein